MYLSYYGLSRPPFEIAPEPEPFFESPAHLDALSGLIYGITENRGFISITGDPGVGKTTTLYAAAQSLGLTHPSLIWIEFADPLISPDTFLAVLADRLNLPAALTVLGDLGPIRNRLLRQRESGRNLIMVFDAAEELSGDMLAFLDRLAGLDEDDTPLFLIVFIGHPAWNAVLALAQHRSLDRRVAVRATIPALAPALARSYIAFRLTAAGGRPDDIMSPAAIRAVADFARGIPGKIHVLAGQTLDAGAVNRSQPITASDVRAALPNFERVPFHRILASRLPLAWVAAGGVGVAALGVASFLMLHPVTPQEPPRTVASTPPLATSSMMTPVAMPAAPPNRPQAIPASVAPSPRKPTTTAISPPAATPTRGPVAAIKPVTTIAKVREGDNVMSILRRHALPTTTRELRILQSLNPSMGSASLIHPGQSIVLPVADGGAPASQAP